MPVRNTPAVVAIICSYITLYNLVCWEVGKVFTRPGPYSEDVQMHMESLVCARLIVLSSGVRANVTDHYNIVSR
jgi:hypothetical protein